MRKLFIYFSFLLILLGTTAYAQKIKVACIGNSITYGFGLKQPETEAYPVRLQQLLGDKYNVMNFGKSGATLLNRGHRPYIQQNEYKAALAFTPDRIVIHLGINDTDPRDWPNYRDDFVSDYLSLINSFRQVNPTCKVWICRLTPITSQHIRFKSGTRDWYWEIQQSIEEVAKLSGATLIDLQEALYAHPDLLPDAVHPNAEGADIIAHTIHSALTGNYGGLQLPSIYSDNMILQRDQLFTIAGIANACSRVTVSIAGQKQQTTTPANGKWQVTLQPIPSGGPYTLTVSVPEKTLIYTNILIGEVWLCSGQSNMAFRIDESEASEQNIQRTYADRKPQIRFFNMKPRWETNAIKWDASTLDSLNRLQYYKDTKWTECGQETISDASAVAFAFGRMLADSLQIPIGLIMNPVGGSPTEAWIDRKTLELEFPDILINWTQNDFIQDWVRERASLNIQKSENKAQRHPYEPCYLFEAGIRPLGQFPLRGIIWYQGESNAHNREAHEKLFPLLVNSWRKNWDKEELPFYYVQLSSIDRPSWTWFRDSQRRMLSLISNSGMAVSSDHGDSLNVHPTQKKEIGERLAYWALHKTYGRPVTPSGPLFRSAQFTKDAAYITFDYAEGLNTSDGEAPRTFEIATDDGLFVPAKVQIIEGQIKLWNEKVSNPRFVRYGWQPFTRANLINNAGLPASTFRIAKE